MTYGLQGFLNIVDISSTPYNVTSNQPNRTVFYVNASGSSKTINLPPINSVTKGTVYIFKRDSGAYNVVIDPNSSETIDGSSTKSISGTWDSWCVVSNGSQWLTIGYGLS